MFPIPHRTQCICGMSLISQSGIITVTAANKARRLRRQPEPQESDLAASSGFTRGPHLPASPLIRYMSLFEQAHKGVCIGMSKSSLLLMWWLKLCTANRGSTDTKDLAFNGRLHEAASQLSKATRRQKESSSLAASMSLI